MPWLSRLLGRSRALVRPGPCTMTTILRIDSSSRDNGSVSRRVGDHLERTLLAGRPQSRIVRRDVVSDPIPHIAASTIGGFYTPADQMTKALEQATALSDQLIAELLAADLILMSVPMYNFSVPSALKAWIDQIVRIGKTFSYDGTNFTGLVTGKKAFVVCTYGANGYAASQPFSTANFLEPYLRFLLNFIGITDMIFFSVEATTADAGVVAANIAAAQRAIEATFMTA
jgi:FMN-dependent NADH-azoreductase